MTKKEFLENIIRTVFGRHYVVKSGDNLINIAKNNISDISKLKEYKLLTLDLSGNKIKDFSQLYLQYYIP